MALTSVSPGQNTIFVTTTNHDKEGTTLLPITAKCLTSDCSNADICN